MLRFGETKVAKENIYAAKKAINIWDLNIDNIVISKLVETKTNSKYLVLILPKLSGYVKTFKDGDKGKNNELMSFCINDEKLLEKYKTIWTKIEDLKNIKLHALPVYDDRYRKTKIRTYGNNVYTNFCALNVPVDGIECESFTDISIDSLLVYNNQYYLQVYLDNCADKIIDKRMIDYLGENPFQTDED